jgi:hypothetical protein
VCARSASALDAVLSVRSNARIDSSSERCRSRLIGVLGAACRHPLTRLACARARARCVPVHALCLTLALRVTTCRCDAARALGLNGQQIDALSALDVLDRLLRGGCAVLLRVCVRAISHACGAQSRTLTARISVACVLRRAKRQ